MHFRRHSHRKEQRQEDLEQKMQFPQREEQPRGEQFADRIAFDSALTQLPSGCRSVFVLFDIVGYRHDEIATLLGCSVGTSKSQLHKARHKLRHLLGPTLN
jgi:RNA polymerase sigma-70 factor (ECF subfamily)